MNNIEESIKLAKETKFAVLGREYADRLMHGKDIGPIAHELQMLRRQEQESTSMETRFAGLARMIGDATRNGKDVGHYETALVSLRRWELGPRVQHQL
jgi:hypothetical protein